MLYSILEHNSLNLVPCVSQKKKKSSTLWFLSQKKSTLWFSGTIQPFHAEDITSNFLSPIIIIVYQINMNFIIFRYVKNFSTIVKRKCNFSALVLMYHYIVIKDSSSSFFSFFFFFFVCVCLIEVI